MAKLSPHSKRATAYRWMQEEKDAICSILARHIEADPRSHSAIANAARVSPATVINITHGKTRSPRTVTVELILEALGKDLIIRGTGPTLLQDEEIVKAPARPERLYRWRKLAEEKKRKQRVKTQ